MLYSSFGFSTRRSCFSRAIGVAFASRSASAKFWALPSKFGTICDHTPCDGGSYGFTFNEDEVAGEVPMRTSARLVARPLDDLVRPARAMADSANILNYFLSQLWATTSPKIFIVVASTFYVGTPIALCSPSRKIIAPSSSTRVVLHKNLIINLNIMNKNIRSVVVEIAPCSVAW